MNSADKKKKKIAVVLLNLGGPDSLEAVRPFLFNLFNDKAIIRLPQPFRYLLAAFISSKRAPKTQAIYRLIDNQSPLLALTQEQAKALELRLKEHGKGDEYRCFITMRYWHPLANKTVQDVKNWQADEVILLPLYPQFSSTTTASSVQDWKQSAKKSGLNLPTKTICCYPGQADFIKAHSSLILQTLQGKESGRFRLLFSAHGLPEKIIKAGDPYQWQVEHTVAAVVERLRQHGEEVDYSICYQSRVGPLKWIGPSTEEEIARAGAEKKDIVLIPIAFVSEHSETLVELDIEYKHLAEQHGVTSYVRVPALACQSEFIESLKCLVFEAQNSPKEVFAPANQRICPRNFSECPCKN